MSISKTILIFCIFLFGAFLVSAEATKEDTATTATPNSNITATPVANASTPATTEPTTEPPENATTEAPTSSQATASPAVTTTTKASTTTKSSSVKTTVSPTKPTIPASQRFDAASFIGGIVLCGGLIAIIYFGCKFYKARNDRNYHQF